MITSMVQRIELTRDSISFLSYPDAELVLQTNGLFEMKPVLRPLFCRIVRVLPFSTKNVQITAANLGVFATDFWETVSSRVARVKVQPTDRRKPPEGGRKKPEGFGPC
jgi:hypothetical protein